MVFLVGVSGGCGPPSNSSQDGGPLNPVQLRSAGMGDPEVRLVELALDLADSNRYRRALRLADSLTRTSSDRPQVHYLKGGLLLRRGNTRRAREAFQKSVRVDSSFVPAHRELGRIYRRKGDLQKSLAHWRIATGLRPENPQYQYMLGALYSRLDSLNKALEHLQPIVGELPVRVHTALGRTYSKNGDLNQARAHLKRAIGIDSSYAEAHFLLSEVYGSEGNHQNALRSARRAFELRPDSIAYRYRLGRLLVEAGSTRVGSDLLAEVLARDSTHRGALYNQARALRALGRAEEASSLRSRLDSLRTIRDEINRLRARTQNEPKDPQLWYQLGRNHERLGQKERAAQAYRRALSLVPTNLALANNVANLMIEVGDTTEALQTYRTILRRDSTVTTAWLNLGAVYAKKGREEEARKAWKKVLKLRPGHRRARRYLAQLGR